MRISDWSSDVCSSDLARRGEMIKIHGANVAPLEVELAMTGLLGIEKAGVVGVARNGDTLLAAAVLMAPGRALDEAAVIAELKRRPSSLDRKSTRLNSSH